MTLVLHVFLPQDVYPFTIFCLNYSSVPSLHGQWPVVGLFFVFQLKLIVTSLMDVSLRDFLKILMHFGKSVDAFSTSTACMHLLTLKGSQLS